MRTIVRKLLAVTGAGILLAGVAACAPAATDSAEPSDPGTPDIAELSGSITVFAAASLTATFTEIVADFEDVYPGSSVELSFAGSSALVAQLSEGAPADVFASADTANMDALLAEGLAAGEPVDFATNFLTIAVPPGNPGGVQVLADLADPGLSVVICAPQVPCGAATQSVTESAGVVLTPASEESAVTDVLGKVISGEADAGLVYVTDAAGAGAQVEAIDFPEASTVINTYPIVPLGESGNPALAQAFVDYVTGPQGLAVLQAAGFGAP